MDKSVPARHIGWRAAATALAAAVARAETLGVKVNVAVVDSGGNLAGFLRMPGAFLPSIDIAIDKAWTAAGFGFPTIEAPAVLAGLPENVRAGLAGRPRVTFFGGGVPLFDQGVPIGGIGVSGGSDEQDHDCALAGVAALDAA
ncbi:GlcG/HbpS family heme-binding protein [Zavarzinia compransoris]|uniref:Cobalamin adenosyltransferase n=1 Tax=Zavarzinia compransoris TaxID=1264899 RepID=A0A317EA68_9PROT|nr:heme-binding protein [Zavarzinia compransoris]PWR23442.1 cobalamin adenosyltransferase [Zavarzinia compransoris]TDP45980.1 uncharacterized protein GlcG (DUF336 family) [Zavarzinia compransoris]